ncbi:MAG: PLP-dependent aminotransferase family protein [Chloroflexi bacterium]|nr:PLP-dependent aminotransferase family protein [Chloroflexota bacterium]
MSFRLDLKTGYPNVGIAPLGRLSTIAAEVVASGRGFQYGGDLQGHGEAREQIARFLSAEMKVPAAAEQLMLTTGALTAIDIVCRTLTQPGDIVVVEDPTFFFAVDLLKMSHCQVVGVPMCEDGLDLEALRDLIQANPKRVKLVYTIPSFQNPTGYTATDQHRTALVRMAQEHDFHVLEDATYQPLFFGELPPPPLKHYDQGSGRVVTVASVSKLLMPSLRLGWIWATPEQCRSFLRYKSDAASSRLTAEIVAQFMQEGEFTRQAAFVRQVYGSRHDALVQVLKDKAPDWLSWHAPGGGFFIWASLPVSLTARALEAHAHARGVDFFPGRACYVDPPDDQSLRLCFALHDEPLLREAGEAFCEALRGAGAAAGLG